MKSSKNVIILIVLIIVSAVAISGCTSNATSTTINPASTKVAFINNGTTWFHYDAVIENMTLKNGTVQNYYVEGYIKPDSNNTIDLSNLAGYGNQPLPAGTKIRIMAYKGLLNQTLTSNSSNLDLILQGWSKTLNPQSSDLTYNVTLKNITVNQLPANITNNTLIISPNVALFNQLTPEINAKLLPVFEEEILTVDANGKVTITFVTPAKLLCNVVT